VIDMAHGPAVLSQVTIDEIDADVHPHVPSAVRQHVGAGLPFSIGTVISLLLPWFLKAVEALIASGVTAPSEGQVLAKAAELRAAAGP
jgi:hypothetical protein